MVVKLLACLPFKFESQLNIFACEYCIHNKDNHQRIWMGVELAMINIAEKEIRELLYV